MFSREKDPEPNESLKTYVRPSYFNYFTIDQVCAQINNFLWMYRGCSRVDLGQARCIDIMHNSIQRKKRGNT